MASVTAVNCVSEPGKSICEAAGGHCIVRTDGYYIMSGVCVALGGALLVRYIIPTVKRLQGELSSYHGPDPADANTALPMSAWRVKIPN